MKGSIVDVYPAGGNIFRACVLRDFVGDSGDSLLQVVNLDTGNKHTVYDYEVQKPLINDIQNVEKWNTRDEQGRESLVNKIKALRYKLLNKTLGGVSACSVAGRKIEIEYILRDLQNLINEETED